MQMRISAVKTIMNIHLHRIVIVAAKEFRDGVRNRWVLAITSVLGVFGVGISYYGAAASGSVGFASLPATLASLTSLAAILIPLIALLLAYDSIVAERERGSLALLLSYPLTRTELLLGKYLGHGVILLGSTVAGFGFAALVIEFFSAHISGVELWVAFTIFIFSTTMLGWVFLGIAYIISAGATERGAAGGLAMIVWFVFVILFDLSLLGLLVGTGGGPVGRMVVPYLLLLNPTDVFRLINISRLGSAQMLGDVGAMTATHAFRPEVLIAVLILWVAAPLALAVWRLNRQEL